MQQATILRSEGELQLVGEISFTNVTTLRKMGDQLIQQVDRPLLNLAQAQCQDSSACVLILAWMRGARAQGKSIQLLEIPDHLLAVAEVYGIKDVIQSHPSGSHKLNKVIG